MPKLKILLMTSGTAAIMLTSVALADAADDRSYLPPQSLQAQAKDLTATPQTGRRARGARYTAVRHNGRGPSFRGLLRAIFH
jgi:hypothetical protein